MTLLIAVLLIYHMELGPAWYILAGLLFVVNMLLDN